MIYRDRQDLSPAVNAIPLSNNRDRYLDNCFLLCLNRDDDTEKPEIHRLENNLLRELCHRTPVDRIKSQQQSRSYRQDQLSENDELDEQDAISPRQQYRRKGHQQDKGSQMLANRSRYQRDAGLDSYYTRDRYSRSSRRNPREDYNIVQHSDDELSVYEVYVPKDTLNRLSDKRIDNNMVLIDYEDASKLRDTRGTSVPYGYPPQNVPSQYNNYAPSNQYREYDPQYGQSPFYSNIPAPQQQRPGGYYGNEGDRQLYSPQSGSFLPPNFPRDHSSAINVRRHIYSPSQLPQGLTEGQLVMLLQKGNQYQQPRSDTAERPVQLFPPQKEPQPSTTSAVTVSHQPSPVASSQIEPFQTSDYAPSAQNKISPVPPKIIGHSDGEYKGPFSEEATLPKTTFSGVKPSKDVESKGSNEKKKDKTSDSKKDKKAEKDAGGSSKKESKKEKSSGKDSKKKKK